MLVTFDGAVSELTLRICSPAVSTTFDVYGEGAIRAADDALDFAEMFQEKRSPLYFGVGRETKDTFTVLYWH